MNSAARMRTQVMRTQVSLSQTIKTCLLSAWVAVAGAACVNAQNRHLHSGQVQGTPSAAQWSHGRPGAQSGGIPFGFQNGASAPSAAQPITHYSQADLPQAYLNDSPFSASQFGNPYPSSGFPYGDFNPYGGMNQFPGPYGWNNGFPLGWNAPVISRFNRGSSGWIRTPAGHHGVLVGGFYGGYPLIAPPAYIRNSDGAVFLPPLVFGSYPSVYGNDFWYGGGWPYYDSLYGCIGPMPTYGFSSPVWPGFGIVPSVLSLNIAPSQTMISRYSQSSSAWVTIPGNSRVAAFGDPLLSPMPSAPAPNSFPFELPGSQTRQKRQLPPQSESTPLRPDASDIPLLDEFPPIERPDRHSSATDRIQSLHHQSSGDAAFRRSDYVTAEVFYRTAIETAPDRRAPWVRMAFAKLATGQFESATGHLKTGLLPNDDKTRSWITANELYGAEASDRMLDHASRLWEWVGEEPLSTDRLLMASAFQFLRGDDATANDLLSLIGHNGPEEVLLTELRQITTADRTEHKNLSHVGPPPFPQLTGADNVAIQSIADENQFRPAANVASEPTSRSSQQRLTDRAAISAEARKNGIFLRGRRAEKKENSDNSPADEPKLESGSTASPTVQHPKTPDDQAVPKPGPVPESQPEPLTIPLQGP